MGRVVAWGAGLALLVALAAPARAAEQVPGDATLVYLNARLAVREGRNMDAARLWFLRNAMRNQTGRVSPHDADFHSLTWAALGELGVCQDGLEPDFDGAGLWPLALYNHLVRTRGRNTAPEKLSPFETFDVGRQQRLVSINDVLGSEELRSLTLFRGRCLGPVFAMVAAGDPIWASLRDREVTARTLEFLLERARITLKDDVRGRAVVEARLFDVGLQRIELAARAARRRAREQAVEGRIVGLSSLAAELLRDHSQPTRLTDDSEPARILRACGSWPVEEWMSLSDDRRAFLWDQAVNYRGRTAELDARAVEILDAHIARGNGAEVMRWIPRVPQDDATEPHALVWSGERGRRLLALDRESGFGERSVIALHRGVAFLAEGDLDAALRDLAGAVRFAPGSARSVEVEALALRWVSYVASRFEVTDTLLITLQELLPRQAYGSILEDLMWSAALRADGRSFRRGLANQIGRGALERRLELLVPLADGDRDAFSRTLQQGLRERPAETVRFLNLFVQRLELEDGEVRRLHFDTLVRIRALLEPLADPVGSGGGQARRAAALQERTLAILEGIRGLPDAGVRDRARAMDPEAEIFAGSVRLAPTDPLPWPFAVDEVGAPSIYSPIELTPVEGLDDAGETVYSWSIEG